MQPLNNQMRLNIYVRMYNQKLPLIILIFTQVPQPFLHFSVIKQQYTSIKKATLYK